MIPGADSRKQLQEQGLSATAYRRLVPGLVEAGSSDPELARVAAAWPHLPSPVRAAILDLLATAEG